MKKTLLLLTTLTCMSLSAGRFEDIRLREGINADYLEKGKPLPRGLVHAHAVVSVLMYYYNPQLVGLIPVADPDNKNHERVIRWLVHHYNKHVRPTIYGHKILNAFAARDCSFDQFLAYAKEHIDEVFPESIDVVDEFGNNQRTYKRRKLNEYDA